MKQISHEKIEPIIAPLKMRVFTSILPANHVCSSWHLHKELELMYVEKGSIEWTFNAKKFTAYEGDCVFVNYFIPHSTYCAVESAYIVVQFTTDDLFEQKTNMTTHLYNFMVGAKSPFSHFKKDSVLCQNIVGHIKDTAENSDLKGYYNKLTAYSSSIKIVAELIKENVIEENYFSDSINPNIKKILPIVNYVEENYSEGISLDDISYHCGFNSVYLCRIFKQATGKTIVDFINYVKIQNCLKQLKDPQLSITQVAINCGFSNISHFNTTFKKQIGCSPSTYRKSKL